MKFFVIYHIYSYYRVSDRKNINFEIKYPFYGPMSPKSKHLENQPQLWGKKTKNLFWFLRILFIIGMFLIW